MAEKKTEEKVVKYRFTTVYDSAETLENSGEDFSNSIKPTFKKVIDPETGVPRLEKTGEIDIQDEIDAYENDTKVYNMLDSINQPIEMFKPGTTEVSDEISDMTSIGDDPHAMIAQAKMVNDRINDLPPEVQNKYGNNFGSFDFMAFMKDMIAAEAAKVKTENNKVDDKKEVEHE